MKYLFTLLCAAAHAFAQTATTEAESSASTQVCESYGIDFQSGGSYFQNASSTAPFTFVSVFEGCNPDICQNLLVDPSGNEYVCSNTSLTPDDSYQQSTCGIDKNQLTTGEWSILLISNNGDGAPIAYERDIYLSVGIPTTITVIPTVTVNITTTFVTNTTTTSTVDVTTTSNTTVTSPLTTITPTVTIHPRVTVNNTITLGTVTKVVRVVSPTYVTSTYTAGCHIPPRQPFPDPWCTKTPTKVQALALQTPAFRAREAVDIVVPLDRKERLKARQDRLKASPHRRFKRNPDSATVTVTDTNTADYSTLTNTITAGTSTLTITSLQTLTITTIHTVTVLNGTVTAPVLTRTAPTSTVCYPTFTVITITTTKTLVPSLTIMSIYTPTQSISICSAKGGHWW